MGHYLDHAEADIHPRSDGLIRHDPVGVRVCVQGGVDKTRLLVGEGLLAVDLVGERGEELLENLPCYVDTVGGGLLWLVSACTNIVGKRVGGLFQGCNGN